MTSILGYGPAWLDSLHSSVVYKRIQSPPRATVLMQVLMTLPFLWGISYAVRHKRAWLAACGAAGFFATVVATSIGSAEEARLVLLRLLCWTKNGTRIAESSSPDRAC